MSIDPTWGGQAVSAMDVSALAASENIAGANTDDRRNRETLREDYQSANTGPIADVTELTIRSASTADEGGLSLRPGSVGDSETGLLRPQGATGESSALDYASEYLAAGQIDRAFSSNLASLTYTDQQYLGHIVDYVA